MGPVRGERKGSSNFSFQQEAITLASHLTVRDLSIPYVHFVKRGRFPLASAFSQGAEPQLSAFSWFPLFFFLGEEDKKGRSLLFQPLASKGCPLSAGFWSSLLRGSRIPYIVFLPPGFPWFLCRRLSRSFSFSASTRSNSLTRFQWIRWLRSSSLKNGTAVVRRQARSDLGRSTLES
jgi:hypothetical protein